MRIYRRRLPHWDAPGHPVFVTWSLFGAVPEERVFYRGQLDSREVFAAWERLHDAAQTGFRWLAREDVAGAVVDGLLRAEAAVEAFVVMPNHVHVLWTPRVSLPKLMQRLKAGTATVANRMIGRDGQRFWQEECFDRLVRSGEEGRRVKSYIEMNPVKAGLVSEPKEFPWSSAWKGRRT